MSFRFGLQTLQKLREQTRQECRLALAEAYAIDRQLLEQKNVLQATLVENELLVREGSQQSALHIDGLIHARRYEVIIKMQIAEVMQQQQNLTSIIEQRRQALLHAEHEVKILEKLKDKQYNRYLKKFEKLEDQELGEAAIRGFRQRSEEHNV
jgi:flagellar protein FliJ